MVSILLSRLLFRSLPSFFSGGIEGALTLLVPVLSSTIGRTDVPIHPSEQAYCDFFRLYKVAAGMLEHPEKYPDSVVFFGYTATGRQKESIGNLFRSEMKKFDSSGPRRSSKSDFSDFRRISEMIQIYDHQLQRVLPSQANPHATAVALTADSSGAPSVGIYDNGKRKVIPFNVVEFAKVIRYYWTAYFFNIVPL